MFATAVPGLGPLLAREIDATEGLASQGAGFDGRSDVVLFDATPSAARTALRLRLAEDVHAEIGRTLRSEGDRPGWIAGRIWRPERAQRALTTKATVGRPPRRRSTFRVIARVLQERSFRRTDLRREFTDAVLRTQPQWRFADPAEVEIWVCEYQQGRILAGLRLSDAAMRQHDGRSAERSGALRPTVAAAMVALAGQPGGTLLDPCCGSGTILAEAALVGWSAQGIDIDPQAVEVATRNAPDARVEEGDARKLTASDGSVGAYVSNLPFGQQYGVQGTMESWLTKVMAEAARVTRPGGRVVVLAPAIPRNLRPNQLKLTDRHPIRLLGTKTTIWAYDRR